jgi:hypothetical protein
MLEQTSAMIIFPPTSRSSQEFICAAWLLLIPWMAALIVSGMLGGAEAYAKKPFGG